MKATSYINDAIKDKKSKKQLNILVSYVDIIGLCNSVAILWENYVMWPKLMSREVAALPFQAHANYGTWTMVNGGKRIYIFIL